MDGFDYDQGFDVEEFLDESQELEEARLEDALEEVNKQLERRKELHEETVCELESKLEWYIDRLERLYKQSRGRGGRRERLKSKIEGFYEDIREENLRNWRDRQELERQRRELLQSLDEVSNSFLADRDLSL